MANTVRKSWLKLLEQRGKRFLLSLLGAVLGRSGQATPPRPIKRVGVYRLDQRIGNGLLLLPLLNQIRRSLPEGEIHLLIHQPVARLFRHSIAHLQVTIWEYDQPQLLRRPWQLLALLYRWRRLKLDVLLSCHNPDGFSLSQALWGRLCRPAVLVGFAHGAGLRFYDVPVTSSPNKHYADAMLDLWRPFDSEANLQWPSLHVDAVPHPRNSLGPEMPLPAVCLWLGATGNKVLPAGLVAWLEQKLTENFPWPVVLLAGPADEWIVQRLPEPVRSKVQLWKGSLLDTARLFQRFRLFVSGDTGPLHLAFALGVPTLSIFVNSRAVQYGYQDGREHFAVEWKNRPTDYQKLSQILHTLKEVLTAHAPA